jgi:hypothetical protein
MDLKQTELIEAYLRGELSGPDKAAFETQLSQDPLFQSEIELQGDIVNSLKAYRKSQLKARLNSIDVTSSTLISVGALKLITSLVVTAFLGFTGYYFYNHTPVENQSPRMETSITVNPEKTEGVQKTDKKEITPSVAVVEEKEVAAKARPVSKNISSKKAQAKEKVITPNVIDSFAEHTGISKEGDLDISEESKSIASEGISEIEISHEEKTATDLKYKYLNKKLYLYGNFGSVAYELLELNSNFGKKLFLFHNNKYYQLEENQTTISPLRPLSDSLVIQELDTLRQNRTN